MWAFYGAIRKSVAENQPWDKFARSIVTAKGDSQTNGLANYFVLHRDPIDLTESASMAFLGLSLTCARCHNHPMEKWTQDQYYGMANLFRSPSGSRTAAPRETLLSRPHPRAISGTRAPAPSCLPSRSTPSPCDLRPRRPS